ncbi:hypothetical protein AB4Z48_05710 [Cupriavidus sp. 2TAF22]|uniref:hypothetical protein n=1 Tax=unclassified Cupriavidus TaxID=2640874 RepID=UPI003F90CDEC
MNQTQGSLPRPLPRPRAFVALALLCGACATALPAYALPAGAPERPVPPSLREDLALTPAQTTLWHAARAAQREARAHALELRARFIREGGEIGPMDPMDLMDPTDPTDPMDEPGTETPLRERAAREDRLRDALEHDRRIARDRRIAFEDSLDAAQRSRLRALAGTPRWAGPPPGAPMGAFPGHAHGPAPMPCAIAGPGPAGVPGAAAPYRQEAKDAR